MEEDYYFLGYKRLDESIGIRNHILILPGDIVSYKVANFVHGTKSFFTADYGTGRTKKDRETIARTLIGLGKNPNVAGVIIHNVRPGSQYPELKSEVLAEEISKSKKPVEVISTHSEGSVWAVYEKSVRTAKLMVIDASRLRRDKYHIKNLCVGVKCGASDATSGMAGNPVVGKMFDKIIDSGGTCLFGESTEVIGAEDKIIHRAINRHVAEDIEKVINKTKNRINNLNEDIITTNPVPENKMGGISTLEEKSLGAISKSGSKIISGVLRYGEIPAKKGLFFVDNWMSQYSIFSGYAAAGAHVLLHQLGGAGYKNVDLFSPSLGIVSPVMWLTANKATFNMARDSLDFYSGKVIEGKISMDEAGDELLRSIIDIASGTLAKEEALNYPGVSQFYLEEAVF